MAKGARAVCMEVEEDGEGKIICVMMMEAQ